MMNNFNIFKFCIYYQHYFKTEPYINKICFDKLLIFH